MSSESIVVGRRVMDIRVNQHGVIIAIDGPRISKNQVSVQLETGQLILTTLLEDSVEGFELMPMDGNEADRPDIQKACSQSAHTFDGDASTKHVFWRQRCDRCGISRMALEQILGQEFTVNVTGTGGPPPDESSRESRGSDLDENGDLRKPVRDLIPDLHEAEDSVDEFLTEICPDAIVRMSGSPTSERQVQLMRSGRGGEHPDEYDREEHGRLLPLWVVVEMPGDREPPEEMIAAMAYWKYTPLDGEHDPDYGGGGWPVPPAIGPDRLDITGCYVFRRTWV